jgi:hypothetical protein
MLFLYYSSLWSFSPSTLSSLVYLNMVNTFHLRVSALDMLPAWNILVLPTELAGRRDWNILSLHQNGWLPQHLEVFVQKFSLQ